MRRVLITSTYFAEEVYLGTLRVTALARYLPEHGWQPVILTPKVPGPLAVDDPRVPVVQYADVKSPYGRVKQALGGQERMTLEEAGASRSLGRRAASLAVRSAKAALFPDPSVLWWPYAVRAGVAEARARPVEAILSTSNPVTPHLIAASLKRRLTVPWIADFRDLWTLNHYRDAGRVRQWLEEALERRTLRNTDLIVTITDEYIARLRAFLGPGAPPMEAIPLGVDRASLPAAEVPLTSDFTLTYTGLFIEDRRDPATLFSGLRLALDRGWVDRNRVRVRHYGPRYPFVERRAAEAGISDLVELNGYVSRDEALRRQRESQVVLLFLWDHPAEAGAFSGKLEFLFTGRPVLVTGGPPAGIWERLVASSGAGRYAGGPEDVADYLRDAYQAYLRTGSAPTPSGTEALVELDYRTIVGRFAEALDRITR